MEFNGWKISVQEKMEDYPGAKIELELALETLLARHFSRSNDYAKEKFCKSFCETIFHIKSLWEERNGTSITCVEDGRAYVEIRKRLINDIERLAYNYDVFLSSVRMTS